MQPHQFSYCSCLPPFKDSSQTLHIGFLGNRGTQSVRTPGAPQKTACPHQAQTHPFTSWAFLQHCWVWLWRCKPLGWDTLPTFLHARIWHSCAQPICGPRPAMWLSQAARPRLPDPGKHGAKWAKFPKSPNSSAPRKGSFCGLLPGLPPRRGVWWDPKAGGAAGGEGARRRAHPGSGRCCPTLGTKWPHCTPTAEPGLLAKWRTEGWEWSPQVASRARGAWAGSAGDGTPQSDTTPRAGAARHSHSASSAHSGQGAGRASSRSPPPPPPPPGQSTWEGVPTGEPHFLAPPPYFRGSRPRAAPRSSDFSVSTACTPSPPFLGRRHDRRPKFGWNFLGCAAKQPRCVLPPRPPPPPQTPPAVAAARPAAFGTGGFPQEEAPARAARGVIYYESSDTPSLANPRRVRTRLNSLGWSVSQGRASARGVVKTPELESLG